MSTPYAAHLPSSKQTPQSQPVPGRTQVENSAGGYVFSAGDWERLDRFLILGCETNTYYASAKNLTVENAECVLRCANSDYGRAVDRITEISVSGRAPKNTPAVFALAILAGRGSALARHYALEQLTKVCRIPTDLFAFVEAVNKLRGWGRSIRSAIANWYTSKEPDRLAYAMVKYQQRNNWSHANVLKLAHVRGRESTHGLFRWALGHSFESRDVKRMRVENGKKVEIRTDHYGPVNHDLPQIIRAFEVAKRSDSAKEICSLIAENGLTREMIPTKFLTEASVWESLLANMPMTAMIRNLGNMSKVGLLAPLSEASRTICSRLANREVLKKARIHPIGILNAMTTYSAGKSVRGDGAWSVVPDVVDALNDAFYLAFDSIVPTNKRWLLGVDVSGSMQSGNIAGLPGITPIVGAAAMSLVTKSTEKDCHILGFSHQLVDIKISPRQRLDDVCQTMVRIPMGGTDCALPMIWAKQNRVPVDIFVVYTDNETWYGGIHPFQALKDYRNAMGIDAKMIVVAFTATDFTIADPNDAGMMDVVGFDASAPSLMSQFAGGIPDVSVDDQD